VPLVEVTVNAKTGAEEKVTKKNFLGFIRGVEGSNLLLESDGVEYKIALSNIDKSRLNPVF
jgi:ribosome maturation factor RimP